MKDHKHEWTRYDGPASYHVAYRCRNCGLVVRYEESDDGKNWRWEFSREGEFAAMVRGMKLNEASEYAGLSCVGDPEKTEPLPSKSMISAMLGWIKKALGR